MPSAARRLRAPLARRLPSPSDAVPAPAAALVLGSAPTPGGPAAAAAAAIPAAAAAAVPAAAATPVAATKRVAGGCGKAAAAAAAIPAAAAAAIPTAAAAKAAAAKAAAAAAKAAAAAAAVRGAAPSAAAPATVCVAACPCARAGEPAPHRTQTPWYGKQCDPWCPRDWCARAPRPCAARPLVADTAAHGDQSPSPAAKPESCPLQAAGQCTHNQQCGQKGRRMRPDGGAPAGRSGGGSRIGCPRSSLWMRSISTALSFTKSTGSSLRPMRGCGRRSVQDRGGRVRLTLRS